MGKDDGAKDGANGEDLLSKLFDMDEAPDHDDTVALESEFESKTNTVKQSPSRSSAQNIDLEESANAEHTELMRPNPESSKKSLELGDNLFDGILEEDDGTIADDKINFFDDMKSGAKPAPQVSAQDVKENTIMLDKPLDLDSDATKPELASAFDALDNVSNATQQDDPIDRALMQNFEPEIEAENLRKMAKPKASPQMQMQKAAGANEQAQEKEAGLKSSLMDDLSQPTPTDENMTAPRAKAEVSAKDFAEVFSSAPIQVPDSSIRRAKKFNPRILQYAALALIVLAVGGALSFGVMKAKSDAGVMGYRLEGLRVVQSYQPPNEALTREFSLIFESAKEARLSDDIEKVEATLVSLKSVLQRDERNVEAATFLAEHSALLTYWYGLTSVWTQRYDEALQIVSSIQSNKPLSDRSKIALGRAKIWRMLSVHDVEKAEQELASIQTVPGAMEDEELFLLRAQIPFEQNKWGEIAKAMEKTPAPLANLSRAKWLDALGKFEKDGNQARQNLQSLAQANYLPARVFALALSPIAKDSAKTLIDSSETLLATTKNYPHLYSRVLDFRGDVYAALEENEKARAEWKSLTEISARDAKIWLKLADSYEEAAMWDEAIESYRAAQKLGNLELQDLLRFAQLLRIRGKIVEAMTLLDQGMLIYPKAAVLHYEKGRVQLAVYQDDAAKTSYKKALELDPKLENATLGLADLAFQKKEFPEAENLFKKIGPASEYYSKALRGLGQISEIKHQPKDAERFYKEALRVNPKLEALYPHLVEIFLVEERDAEAERLVEQGLKLMPKSPLLKVSLAKVYQFQSRTNDALQILEPILQKYEHVLEVQFTAADIYMDQKNFKRSWEILEPMLNKELRDAELLFLKGRFFYLNPDAQKFGGSTEAAQRAVELAVRRDPENERYRILASQVALRMQDRAQAMDHVEYVLRFRPQSVQAYIMDGDIRMESADYEKAARSYQEALKLTRFQANIYRRLADTYKLLDRVPLAIQYYEKVLKERPTDGSVHMVLGKLYNEEGHTTLATQHLRRTIELEPDEPDAYYYLGFILKEAGDRKGAIRNLERYLVLNPSSKESATIKDELYFLKGSQAN